MLILIPKKLQNKCFIWKASLMYCSCSCRWSYSWASLGNIEALMRRHGDIITIAIAVSHTHSSKPVKEGII